MILSSTQKIAHYGSNIALYDTSTKVLSYSTDDGAVYQDITIPTTATTFHDMLVTPSHVYLAVLENYATCYVISLADGSYAKYTATHAAIGYLVPVFPHVIFSATNTSTDICSFSVFDYQTGARLSIKSFSTSSFFPIKYAKKLSDTTYEIYAQERDSDSSSYYFYVYKYVYNVTTQTVTYKTYYKKTQSRNSSLLAYDYSYASYYYNYKITAYNDYENSKSLYSLTFDKSVTQAAYFVTPIGNVIHALSYGTSAGFFLYEDGKLIDQIDSDILISLSASPEDYRTIYCLFRNVSTGYYIKKYEVFNGRLRQDLPLTEEVVSEAAELDLVEEIDATDFFIDFETTPEPPSFIDLTHLYDGFSIGYLDNVNKNVLASKAISHSQKTSSYIRFETKAYNTKISFDAACSSEKYDYGAVHLTQTATTPSYSTATGRIAVLSGVTSGFTTYEAVVANPGIYYLHFSYTKDSSTISGKDKFFIDNIRLPIFKQSLSDLTLHEKVVDGVICEATLHEKVYSAADGETETKETIYAEDSKELAIKDRVVETLHTSDLTAKEKVYIQTNTAAALKETVVAQEMRGMQLGETIDAFPKVTSFGVNLDIYNLAVYKDCFFGFDANDRFYDLADLNKPVFVKSFYHLNDLKTAYKDHRLAIMGLNTDTKLIEFYVYDMQQKAFIIETTFTNPYDTSYSLYHLDLNNDYVYASFGKRVSAYSTQLTFGPLLRVKTWDSSPTVELKEEGRLIAVKEDHVYYVTKFEGLYRNIRKRQLSNETIYTDAYINFTRLDYSDCALNIEEEQLFTRYFNTYQCYDIQTQKLKWTFDKANCKTQHGVFAYLNHVPALLCVESQGSSYTTHLIKHNQIVESFEGTTDIDNGVFYDNCIYTCTSLSLVGDNYGVITRYALVRDVKINFSLNEFVLDPSGLALTEKIIQDEACTFPIVETIESRKAELAIKEYIDTYKDWFDDLLIYERVNPIPVHNKNLLVYEYVKFKTGEWGEDSKTLTAKEEVLLKPSSTLTTKEEVVKKPDPIITETTLDGNSHFTVFDFNGYNVNGTYEKYEDTETGIIGNICNPNSVFTSVSSYFTNYSEYFMISLKIPAATKIVDRYVGIKIKDGYVFPLVTEKWHSEIPGVYRLARRDYRRKMTQDDFLASAAYGEKVEFSGIANDMVYFKIPSTVTKFYFRTNYNIEAEVMDAKLYEVNSFNDWLNLKETVMAYSSGLSVHETSKPNLKFDCYDLTYLENKQVVEDTYEVFDLTYPLYKDGIVFFETNVTPIKHITRFSFFYNNDSGMVQSMLYEPDYYIINQDGKEKFCYGFAVPIPLRCYTVAISRSAQGDPFTVLNIYQADTHPKTLGETYLKLTEEVKNYEKDMAIKEAIFEEGTFFTGIDYMPLHERVIALPAVKTILPVKEEVVGTFGRNYLTTRETIKINERPAFTDYYLGDSKAVTAVPFPDDHYTAANKRVWFIDVDELLLSKLTEEFNVSKRTFLRAHMLNGQNFMHDFFAVVAGLVDASGKLVRYDNVIDIWFDQERVFTKDITPYLDVYLKKQNLSSQGLRIGFLGVSPGNVFLQPRYFMDFAIIQSVIESDTVDIKENVLENANNVKTPAILYTYRNSGRDKSYYLNDTIPLTDVECIIAPMDEPVVPKRLIFETSEPITTFASQSTNGYGYESYKQDFSYTLTEEGHYLYDIEIYLNNLKPVPERPTAPISELKFFFSRTKPSVVFYNIELYYDSIKQMKRCYLRETVHSFLPNKRLYMKEYVYIRPAIGLELKEVVERSIYENRAVSCYEYVTTKDHVEAAKTLGMKETVKHPTWSRALLLQEVVPADPVKDNLPLYEYVIDKQDVSMPIKENVVVYKNGVDGKVMVEIVK